MVCSVEGMTSNQGNTPRQETLAQFSVQLSAYAKRPIPFAETVRELAVVRARIRVIDARRKPIYEQLASRYRTGVTRTSTGLELRSTAARPGTVVRTVDAATVKARYPRAYEAARCVGNYVSIKAPSSFKEPVVKGLPAKPPGSASLDALVKAYQHASFACLPELRQEEKAAIAVLREIAEEFGWDGLPYVFADHWSVGLRKLRYQASLLAVNEPEIFDELAVERERGAATGRIYIATHEHDIDDEVEGDGYAQ